LSLLSPRHSLNSITVKEVKKRTGRKAALQKKPQAMLAKEYSSSKGRRREETKKTTSLDAEARMFSLFFWWGLKITPYLGSQ